MADAFDFGLLEFLQKQHEAWYLRYGDLPIAVVLPHSLFSKLRHEVQNSYPFRPKDPVPSNEIRLHFPGGPLTVRLEEK